MEAMTGAQKQRDILNAFMRYFTEPEIDYDFLQVLNKRKFGLLLQTYKLKIVLNCSYLLDHVCIIFEFARRRGFIPLFVCLYIST